MFEIGWGPDTENKQTDNGQNSLKKCRSYLALTKQADTYFNSIQFTNKTKYCCIE